MQVRGKRRSGLLAMLAVTAIAAFGAACGDDDEGDASSAAADVSAAVDSAAAQVDLGGRGRPVAGRERGVRGRAPRSPRRPIPPPRPPTRPPRRRTPPPRRRTPPPRAPTRRSAAEGVVDFEETEAGSGEGLKLGYISLGDSVPFVKLVSDSIKREAEKAGAELVFCDSQVDGQKALDCARNFKTQGVQAYLNFQVDQKLSGAICEAGPQVPVIAIDIVQEPCQVAFMGAANEYAGNIAGEAIGKFAKDTWNCEYDAYVSLESTAAADANRLRMGGTRDGFTKYCEIKNEKVRRRRPHRPGAHEVRRRADGAARTSTRSSSSRSTTTA